MSEPNNYIIDYQLFHRRIELSDLKKKPRALIKIKISRGEMERKREEGVSKQRVLLLSFLYAR